MTLRTLRAVQKIESRHLNHFKKDFPEAELVCVCDENNVRKSNGVIIAPWQKAFKILKLG